jgi:hypothetical protein
LLKNSPKEFQGGGVSKESLLSELSLFSIGGEGIGGWLSTAADDTVFSRLDELSSNPLKKVQLNQLLGLCHEAPLGDDFFSYYWLRSPSIHPYPTELLTKFDPNWLTVGAIVSIEHLKWGLYRLYVDALLYFGNVRTCYRALRALSKSEIEQFFSSRRFDTDKIKDRGPAMPLTEIARDDRYLIAEMACKSYGEGVDLPGKMKEAISDALSRHLTKGGKAISIRALLDGERLDGKYLAQQTEFSFSLDEVLDETVESQLELEQKYERIAKRFYPAREAALRNTEYYLSMVNDLDVYVATSMRKREDFRSMATLCDEVFSHSKLKDLNLRYFDPTLSAAKGHEDKGLIECLMVKCAKALVYQSGATDSWGKDAEAAMALSLGKPVIFFCANDMRLRVAREIHPLTRLIEFSTGIAVGAMVTDKIPDIIELLSRIFTNKMQYILEHPKEGYLRLREQITNSVIRLQTNDRLLAETFWNHYHNDATSRQALQSRMRANG